MRARLAGSLVLASLALVCGGALLIPEAFKADDQRPTERRLAGQPVACTAAADAALLGKQVLYTDGAVRPSPDCAPRAIAAGSRASRAASGWTFAPNDLARAIATAQAGPASDDLTPDLVRARSVGAPGRAIVVDNASARLWMLENGRVIDSMKVIVGKPAMATPEMAGRITYATLNPYWNIPPDIVRASVAPKALSLGLAFLARQRFELVDRYGLAAQPVDPATVDWKAVMAGRQKVGVRQLPGGSNMMGAVKFIFPNTSTFTTRPSAGPSTVPTGGSVAAVFAWSAPSTSIVGCSAATCRAPPRGPSSAWFCASQFQSISSASAQAVGQRSTALSGTG